MGMRLSLHRADIPEPDRSAPAAATDKVTVNLGGERPALSEVSVEVRYGEVLAMVGPNGAGKSTLLGALAGTVKPAGGAVQLAGSPLSRWSPLQQARLRAVLPQQHTAGFGFTCGEVVQMGRAPWTHTDRQDDDARTVAEALAECDVSAMAPRPFAALSGGERARVALARVLAQDTSIIMLDEPTAALDLKHQEDVMQIVRHRADAGDAVVVVVHDLNLAAAYADRVAVLAAGQLRASGPVRETLTGALLTEVFEVPIEVTGDDAGIRIDPVRGVSTRGMSERGLRI
ncbi:heme ABC transporter ATP-binding protein [Speluncibacter jeojiensis]|uniref:heme ABC transporter ATP-binding protein n=1 Tax=Speluncibacter jeojiensis TaxID=2710754 RepID=UPI0038CD2296